MCSEPITQDDLTFACRRCDECIATRRHGWVARAMAEKTDHAHTVCLALTYSDDTQESRDAAAMFCYADVRDFMKRLRSAAAYQAKKQRWNIVPTIRFLCAGEQGDRSGRCHWHMIIYSNFDLNLLGKFRLRGKLVSHRRDMITEGKRKRRLNWTLWSHGFITMQEPDQGGMSYVLSYCLKDQFTQEKSKGTMREAKSENFATGLFRMSKRPAIGNNFLMRKMEDLEAKGACLPSLNLKIPNFAGYWQPSGSFRKKLLWALVALNKRILWTTGAPAPQWSSLLASCSENEADMEILNGPAQEEQPDTTDPDYQDPLALKSIDQRETSHFRALAAKARRCNSELPCGSCLRGLPADIVQSLGVAFVKPEGAEIGWWAALDGFDDPAERWKRNLGRRNPYCQIPGASQSCDAPA